MSADMVRKGHQAIPQDLESVLDSHGLRLQFEAMSLEGQEMYLFWIDEAPERRKRRIELLVRSLRRNQT
jgi:uncharacterized protein YdeI (YjbR/CyaY-like superfamily)